MTHDSDCVRAPHCPSATCALPDVADATPSAPAPMIFDSEPGAEPTQSRRAWLDAVVERAPLQRYVTALSRRRAQLIRRLLQASNAPAPAGAAPPPAPSHPHHRTPEEARPWPTRRRR